MCVGCREMKPKMDLIRIVKNREGDIDIDLKGKAPGRGAYICNDIECLHKAIKNKLLDKALDHKIDNDVYKRLEEVLIANGEGKK
jgi:uncharacterized protein